MKFIHSDSQATVSYGKTKGNNVQQNKKKLFTVHKNLFQKKSFYDSKINTVPLKGKLTVTCESQNSTRHSISPSS